MNRLRNKIVLITGAASGIGKATAELFSKEGAIVILSDINDLKGNQALKECRENNTLCEYFHLDVSHESEWMKIFNYIKNKYDRLDILINNAGIGGFLQTKGPHDPENLDMESSNGLTDRCMKDIS